MSGYQESVTDPSFAGQMITFTYPHIGNYGVSAEAMESDAIHARARRDARRRSTTRTRRRAERGWLDWLRDCGVPGDQRCRHARAGAPHPQRGRDARRAVRRRRARSRRRCERLLGEPPMTGRDLAREVTPGAVVASRRGQQRSADRRARHRDQALDRAQPRPRAGARVDLHPCTASAEDAAGTDSRCHLPRPTGPATPPRSDYVVETVRAAGRQAPRCSASASATSCSAGPSGSRRSSCPSAIAAATTRSRTCAPGGSRSPRRTTASRSARRTAGSASSVTSRCAGRPTSVPRSSRHVNLYDRTVEGLTLLDVAGRHRPVPPRGRSRPQRLASISSTASWSRSAAQPECRAATTSTRS